MALPAPGATRRGRRAGRAARRRGGLLRAHEDPSAAGELVYVGHATLLLAIDGVRLLTDPLLGGGFAHVRRRVPAPDPAVLADLDAILISHAHRDHLDRASLRQVARDRLVIAPRGCGRLLARAGAREVVELREGESVAVGGLRVEAVSAHHDGRRNGLGPPVDALGYLVRGASCTVYFAGDTDLFDEMAAMAGDVDVAALPIWGWGPRVGAGHLDPERAARAVALIRPAVAVPIHWGTLRALGAQRGTDPEAPARAFAAAVARVAPATTVHVVPPGGRFALASRRVRT